MKNILKKRKGITSWKCMLPFYGMHRVVNVPLCYYEFSQMKVLGEVYTSNKSRGERSTAINAVWPCVTGKVLATTQPRMEDRHVDELQYFFTHTPMIKKDTVRSAAEDIGSDISELPHVLAKVIIY